MAQRRMFSLKIIDTDLFLDMPVSTQLLYFHLSMRADDDGFVASPKKITKMVNCSDDDLKILRMKNFIIPFESGVCVIKHWKIHNYIQKDRYDQTQYFQEKSQIVELENGTYETLDTKCIQNVSSMDTQVRLGKDSLELGEDSVCVDKPHKNNFTPPSLEDVQAYCRERNNNVNAEKFIDFYSSKGWMVGKNKMKDWKASVRTWEKGNQKEEKYGGYTGNNSKNTFKLPEQQLPTFTEEDRRRAKELGIDLSDL